MKLKFLLFQFTAMLFAIPTYAQGIIYTDTVAIKEMPTEDLVYNAHTWLGNNVDMEDLTATVIKTTRQLQSSANMSIYYDFRVEINDHQYIYTFSNFSHGTGAVGIKHGLIKEEELCLTNPGKIFKIKLLHKTACMKIKADINTHVRRQIKSLREVMRNEIKYKKPVFKDLPPQGIIYSEVIEIPNSTKEALYNKAHVWFSKTYQNVNRVLKRKEIEKGMLIGYSSFKYAAPGALTKEAKDRDINYKVKLQAKKGKLEYTISNFKHQYLGLITSDTVCFDKNYLITARKKNLLCIDMKTKIEEQAQQLIKSLLENIQQQKETDWLAVNANGGYLFSEVIQVKSNLSQDALYEKGIAWFKKEYLNENKVLKIKDRKTGELYANVKMNFKYMGRKDNIRFDLRIQVKDNQYKYSFFNFTHTADESMNQFFANRTTNHYRNNRYQSTSSSKKKANLDFGFIYKDTEKCYVSKNLLMTKKQRQKACTKLKEQIEAEVTRLVNSIAETLKVES